MSCRAVFCDVDGTLLTSDRRITPRTCAVIRQLAEKKIPFVVVSARSPSGIYPIFREYGISGDIVCYSGGLIVDEAGKVLLHRGFTREQAAEITAFAQARGFDADWCAYSVDDWIVRDTASPRIVREENAVHAKARKARVEDWPADALVNKILLICNPEKLLEIEAQMRERFPAYSIAKSSDILLEIMPAGVNKADAVAEYCRLRGIDIADTVAFGDNYNDVEMLEEVGRGVAMGNAPDEIIRRIADVTDDNNHDGIAVALESMNIVSEEY